MITREEMQGKWTQLKGQIREKWGQITDDDLQRAHGDTEQLIGLLQSKTGETRRNVEQFVSSAVKDSQSMYNKATDAVQEYASQASRVASDQYAQMERQMEDRFHDAQAVVRSKPLESLGAAFGAGLVAGVVMSLLMRSSSRA